MSSTTGNVKWFNNAKGWGFLCTEDHPGQDIFVHFSSIKEEGYRTLEPGQAVTFETEIGERGLYAIKVIPLRHLTQQHLR